MDFENLFLGQKLELSAVYTNSFFQGVVKQLSKDRVSIHWVQNCQTLIHDFGTIDYSKEEFGTFKHRVRSFGEVKTLKDFL